MTHDMKLNEKPFNNINKGIKKLNLDYMMIKDLK